MVDDMQGRLRRSTLVIKGLSDNWSDVETWSCPFLLNIWISMKTRYG